MTRGKTPITTDRAHGATPTAARGWVSFVGSGPGDPELLTVRAVTLLEQAEVVVTESPEHVDLVRRLLALPAECETPEFVDGGFGEDGQPLTHAARAKVVTRHAKKGQRVVRLLTGDPFLYASGPEEAQACAKAGIGFEVVPGVSSVSGVPAYAGIPLTTKDHREVAVVTAHEKVDWSTYADDRTLVVLSGVNMVGDIAKALVAAGRDPETPVAMTRLGTTTAQATVTSTLAGISADARPPGWRRPR
jgi:uroporphyrinogen III methyltransferase/synthase